MLGRPNGGARSAIAASIAVLAAIVIAGCGGSSANTLVLYNAQHEQTTAALIAAFTRHTGIRVVVKNDAEDVLTAQLEQEGSRSPADLFYTENSNWLQQLDNRGLLAKVDRSTLANVPAHDSAANGDWVGVSGRFSVMIFDPSKISASQLPRSVMGLADPRYKGKLELAPSETDFWPIVSSIAHTHGNAAALAWLRGIKANANANANVPDNETVTGDVNKGTTDLGLINHYYYYRYRAEIGKSAVHARLQYFAPRDPGYVEDVSGAAILSSSTHQAAAQKFLAFLTGRAGQEVLAHSDSFEYPLHGGVAPNPELPPIKSQHPNRFTTAQLGTGLDAEALLRQAGLI
jgi:iron(III) transport system substrate-binding protein